MITQACEAMRLHHAHDAPRANAFARRRKDRADLDRVVRVIVDHGDDALTRSNLADLGEAALDPGKAVEARCDLFVADTHVQRAEIGRAYGREGAGKDV